MTTSHWQRPHSFATADLSTDVLIVGGGYVGLSTAFWITEFRPDLKVTVIERAQCGSGASGRNAGFLTMGSASFYKGLARKWGFEKAQSLLGYARESLQLVHDHVLKSSPEVKFERTSSLTLFQGARQFESWQTEGFDPAGFGFQLRQQRELPLPLQTEFHTAWETGPEYKVNPMQLLSSLKKRLESRKVTILENVMAFELISEGVRTEVNMIRARQVVLALNAYLPEFLGGFKDLITPRRAQMLSVEIKESFECPHLYYDPEERVYWRKIQDNRLVIGGKRLLDEAGEVGSQEKISPLIQTGLEAYLSEKLRLNYKVINRWSGIMGFTEDELPFIAKIKAPLETYAIGGFSGHGMGLGFKSGMDLAEIVTKKKSRSFFSSFKEVELSV